MSDMEFTGERFLTNYDSPQINYEHWHRYLYARLFCEGKKVLDIASGEGYGGYLLAEQAAEVTGVDISEETVNYAKEHYRRDNLAFMTGDVAQIPVEGQAVFDVVVSFETIEHVNKEKQKAFLQEIKRVLKPEGMLIISTPNKLVYSDLPKYKNEFHIKEFYFREFKSFLNEQFKNLLFWDKRSIQALLSGLLRKGRKNRKQLFI